jgi:dipeptidase D
MGRLLDRLKREVGGLRIFSFEGGSKRNAIPREAVAVIALPTGGAAVAKQVCESVEREFKTEFGPTDPKLTIFLEEAAADRPEQPFDETDSARVVNLLLATPTGVIAMSRDIPGLVETSTNLGVVEQHGDAFRFVCCSRSSIDSALDSCQQSLRAIGETAGAQVSFEGGYPGWAPDMDSKLLATFKRVHEKVTGGEPEVIAIHAGLECGILGERFPGMDMISFGPDMHGVHAPGERLNVPSTQRFYGLLKTLLSELNGD